MEFLLVLAQASDIITGGGWAGFGITGMVLGWLLVIRLPAQDKQLKEMIESRDKLVQTISDRHDLFLAERAKQYEALDEKRRADVKENLSLVLENCHTSSELMSSAIKQAFEQVSLAMMNLQNAIEKRKGQS
jgi:hypothetical protein